jgi:RpiB/LacA/LacB family sugar-phosphate isomerase
MLISMKIAVGADHAGFLLKEALRKKLVEQGHQVLDHGATSAQSSDYPDFAVAVAEDVRRGRAGCGILVCSTGVGMSIAANKIPGVRAALGWDADEVRLTREHNDANVLTLGAKYLTPEKAAELVDVFLSTEFLGGRHAVRISKIAETEQSVRNGAKENTTE